LKHLNVVQNRLRGSFHRFRFMSTLHFSNFSTLLPNICNCIICTNRMRFCWLWLRLDHRLLLFLVWLFGNRRWNGAYRIILNGGSHWRLVGDNVTAEIYNRLIYNVINVRIVITNQHVNHPNSTLNSFRSSFNSNLTRSLLSSCSHLFYFNMRISRFSNCINIRSGSSNHSCNRTRTN
jgi:hypothetical protein